MGCPPTIIATCSMAILQQDHMREVVCLTYKLASYAAIHRAPLQGSEVYLNPSPLMGGYLENFFILCQQSLPNDRIAIEESCDAGSEVLFYKLSCG